MDTLVGVDAYAALDEFLEVVFADEDFLDDAFAAVVASWNASPPDAPERTKADFANPDRPHPFGRARPVGHATGRTPERKAWELRTARSPPGDQQS